MFEDIFVTGANGLLGSYLVPLLKARGLSVQATDIDEFDITCPTLQQVAGINYRCWAAINLAAFTDVPGAEYNPAEAFRVNADCLDWLNRLGLTKVFHISTDYVYDDTIPDSQETDLLKPIGVYGASKAAGDMRLLSYCNSSINIIRTSFKPIIWPYEGAFTDVITNADTVDIIAEMIVDFILASPQGGVYNIGTEPKTIYELAKRNNPDVKPIHKNTDYTITDVTMDLTKYQKFMKEYDR